MLNLLRVSSATFLFKIHETIQPWKSIVGLIEFELNTTNSTYFVDGVLFTLELNLILTI